MSRATVRSAIVNYLTTASIPGLAKVFTAAPKMAQGQDYYGVTTQGGSGAFAFVHINHETEPQIAVGGLGGGAKMLIYDVGLVVRFKSYNTDQTSYMDAYDTIIENIKKRIRSDPRLGTALLPANQQVFISGKEGHGIEVISDLPALDAESQAIHQWSVVTWEITEYLVPA